MKRIKRTTQVCALPGCDVIIEGRPKDIKKYCCMEHSREGRRGTTNPKTIPTEIRRCECGNCDEYFECKVTSKQRFIHGHHNKMEEYRKSGSERRKGRTLEEVYGKEKADEVAENARINLHTPEVLEKARITRNKTYKKHGGLPHSPDCACCICKSKRGEKKGRNNSFYGKHHKEETKRFIGENTRRLFSEGIHGLCDPERQRKRKEAALKALMEVRPSSYEQFVKEIIEGNSLPYEYVGDGEFWVTSCGKHINPDFVNREERIVIEVFEDYWKERTYGSPEKYMEVRSKLFSKIGFETIFIRGNDIQEGEARVLEIIERR